MHFRYPNTVGRRGAGRRSTSRSRAGETVALVGETGAGKSTIVKLVARFYDPTAGGCSSTASTCAPLDLGAFRRQLGVVPQEAFLFTGTIRDNIAYGRPDGVRRRGRGGGARRRRPRLHRRAAPAATSRAVSERGRSRCRPGSASSSRWPGPGWSTPRSCCSTRPRRTSTSAPRPGCSGRWASWPRGARRSSSPTGCRRRAPPTASSWSTAGAFAEGTHDELLASGGRYAAMWEAFGPEATATLRRPSAPPRSARQSVHTSHVAALLRPNPGGSLVLTSDDEVGDEPGPAGLV